MNLTFLRYAVEVEKTGSISLAARNLYLGQPNVSKAIKELELTLGITIFKRTPRGVIPTPKGEEFLHHAKMILSQIDELETMFSEENSEHLSFHIAVPRASYITTAFAEFAGRLSDRAGLDMAFHQANSMEAIDRVAQQEYNLGVIRYDTAYEQQFLTLLGDRNLVSKPIWEMNSLLLISNAHPLAHEVKLDVRQLEDFVELTYGDRSIPFMSTTEARRVAAMEGERKHISIYEHGAVYDLLRGVQGAYCWSSPVPKAVLERNDCQQRRCNGAPMFKDVLIHHRDYHLKEVDKQFIANLNRVKDELAWQEYR